MYKTLVSFDGSPFFFFFFILLRDVWEMFCRPVVQTGNLFCWNFAEDNLVVLFFVFISPQDTQHLYFSHLVFDILWGFLFFMFCCSRFSSVVLQRKRQIFRWNLATSNQLHSVISLFDSQNHVFISPPSIFPGSKWFALTVSLQTHFDTKPLFGLFLTWD